MTPGLVTAPVCRGARARAPSAKVASVSAGVPPSRRRMVRSVASRPCSVVPAGAAVPELQLVQVMQGGPTVSQVV